SASAPKSELHVGEAFVVELTASGAPGTTFEFPKDAGDESVELHEATPASPPPPGVHRYDGMALALGDVELPALRVPYRLGDAAARPSRRPGCRPGWPTGPPARPPRSRSGSVSSRCCPRTRSSRS